MKRFVEGEDRTQVSLLPECLDDYVGEDNPVRVVFIDGLDLTGLGFEGVAPADTGRPAYHPAVLLKLYVYGYLNRLQSRLARQRFSETLPSSSTRRDHADLAFLHGLGRPATVSELAARSQCRTLARTRETGRSGL